MANAGTQDAQLSAGGGVTGSGESSSSFEYDGSAWSNGGSLATARSAFGGAGTLTAGLAFGGRANPSPAGLSATEEYNGTSWTAGGSLNNARRYLSGFGTQTAGVGFGGQPGETTPNGTEEYNGSSWTTGNNTPNSGGNGQAGGTLTAGVASSGAVGGVVGFYDGTNWTTGPTMVENLGGAGGGTQSDHWAAGGGPTSGNTRTQIYNGSAWVTAANMGTARTQLKGKSTSSATALGCGGYAGTTVLTATEEYNVATTAANVKTFTTS